MNFQSELKKINKRLNKFHVESVNVVEDKFDLRNNARTCIMIRVNNNRMIRIEYH